MKDIPPCTLYYFNSTNNKTDSWPWHFQLISTNGVCMAKMNDTYLLYLWIYQTLDDCSLILLLGHRGRPPSWKSPKKYEAYMNHKWNGRKERWCGKLSEREPSSGVSRNLRSAREVTRSSCSFIDWIMELNKTLVNWWWLPRLRERVAPQRGHGL